MSSPISLHVVLDNIPQKYYPNYHFKLPYQYRIKLEMSNSKIPAGTSTLNILVPTGIFDIVPYFFGFVMLLYDLTNID